MFFGQELVKIVNSGNRVALESDDYVSFAHTSQSCRTVALERDDQDSTFNRKVVVAHNAARKLNVLTGQTYVAAAESAAANPNDVNVRTDLGLTFFFRNPLDVDRAIKEYRGSLERDPNHEQSLQNLVVALTRKGVAKEAREVLAKLEQVNPSNPAIAKLRADLDSLNQSEKKKT